jgi:Domain of Unknown Function (DUF748)
MRRAKFWAALVVAVLVVVSVALWISLPSIVRWAATSGIRSATGRDATIDRVEVSLVGGRLAVHALRVAGPPGGAALLDLERLEVRFRLLPILRGRVHLDAITLVAPRIQVGREPSGRLDIADILERFGKGEPAKEPANVVLGRLDVERGAVTFDDRAVTPAHRWEAAGLTVAVRDIATRSDEARGTATVALTLDGAPVHLDVREVRVKRPRAVATLTVTGLDLAPAWTYIEGDPAVRPSGGRFTMRLDVDHAVESGTRAGGEVTLDALALLRRGQDEPLVFTPSLRMTSRDVVYKDGVVTAAHLELTGDPTVVDGSVTPAQRFPIDALHVVVEDASYPARGPARVVVTAGLPSAGTLDIRGTAVVAPVSADLKVTLANVDLKLAKPYVPPATPITPGDGRLSTALQVTYAADGRLGVDGEVRADGLKLMRTGQAEPLVTHPRLTATIAGAALKDGALSVQRLALTGPPTIVDASVTPPQRFTFTVLDLVVEDATWPAQAPARVAMRGEEGGGVVVAKGTFHPGTLAADVRATITALDLTRAAGYVPPDTPVTVARGKLEGTVRLTHDRAAGIGLAGKGALVDLGLVRRGEAAPFVTDARLAFTIGDLVLKDGATSLKSIAVRGAPALADGSVTPARQLLALRGLAIDASGVAWPAGGPAPVRVGIDLPGTGTVTVAGTLTPKTRHAELRVDLQDAALGAYGAWVPIEGPLDGRAGGHLDVTAGFADAVTLTARGNLEVKSLTLGRDPAPVTVAAATVTGIDLDWPKRLRIERATVSRPVALIERAPDGSFPLRAILAPPARGEATPPPPASTAPPPSTPAPAPPDAPREPGLAIEIGEMVIEDGDARFVDRSTTPFFSEEISKLAVTLKGFRNAPDSRSDLTVQAVVGPGGALDLAGQISPVGQPFYLDVAGELRDLAMAQANPYMRSYSGWIARTGSVSTKLHYRVVGDALEASNDVRVQRIKVERAPEDPASANKRVGLPLGLIVAMITDSRGDIAFQVPVTGQLSAPGFSFGDAIWSAIRNVLVNVAAAPFRAIGKLFGGGGKAEEEEFKVDPVPFAAGSADVTADAQQQLQRVADFMRASPSLKLAIGPVVSAQDVVSLKGQEIVARIQRVQRERQLPDFSAAALAVYAQAQPGVPAPKTPEEVVASLREREPAPEEALRRLGARRAELAKLTLVQSAGIEAARLEERPPDVRASDTASGRVEFELLP